VQWPQNEPQLRAVAFWALAGKKWPVVVNQKTGRHPDRDF